MGINKIESCVSGLNSRPAKSVCANTVPLVRIQHSLLVISCFLDLNVDRVACESSLFFFLFMMIDISDLDEIWNKSEELNKVLACIESILCCLVSVNDWNMYYNKSSKVLSFKHITGKRVIRITGELWEADYIENGKLIRLRNQIFNEIDITNLMYI